MIPIGRNKGLLYADSLGNIWRVAGPSNISATRIRLSLIYAGDGVRTLIADEAMSVGDCDRIFNSDGSKVPQFAPPRPYDYSKWYIEKEIVP